ncbi:hypothetical protein KGP17_15410 [Serratia sp. JSRIV001]|uniref:hypothetical protein n=1 Tax=Serratia sp. JSRIV001 TaxID=2831893 RepID=UPI001CBAE03B|nr:hypothetical protein [Serratia sp. JSRIV001]UAN43872.1 hypothetical protein KGP17_15410 [Serratia sp. JSRIV001]
MSASIYSMNGGKEFVWQLGNSRVVLRGLEYHYEVRKNSKLEWRKVLYGRKRKLIDMVEKAIAA